jgi:hypothetical protein
MMSCCLRDRIESSVLLGGEERETNSWNLNERRVKWEGAKRRKLPGTGAKRRDSTRKEGTGGKEKKRRKKEEKRRTGWVRESATRTKRAFIQGGQERRRGPRGGPVWYYDTISNLLTDSGHNQSLSRIMARQYGTWQEQTAESAAILDSWPEMKPIFAAP